MAKAVRYHKQGGPEVLQLDDVTVGDPGQGQVRVRHTAIGVNFVDTYQRSASYVGHDSQGRETGRRIGESIRVI